MCFAGPINHKLLLTYFTTVSRCLKTASPSTNQIQIWWLICYVPSLIVNRWLICTQGKNIREMRRVETLSKFCSRIKFKDPDLRPLNQEHAAPPLTCGSDVPKSKGRDDLHLDWNKWIQRSNLKASATPWPINPQSRASCEVFSFGTTLESIGPNPQTPSLAPPWSKKKQIHAL